MNIFMKNYEEAVKKLQLTLNAEIDGLMKCIIWSDMKDLIINGQKKWEEAESIVQTSRMVAQSFILNKNDTKEFILIDAEYLEVQAQRSDYFKELGKIIQMAKQQGKA